MKYYTHDNGLGSVKRYYIHDGRNHVQIHDGASDNGDLVAMFPTTGDKTYDAEQRRRAERFVEMMNNEVPTDKNDGV